MMARRPSLTRAGWRGWSRSIWGITCLWLLALPLSASPLILSTLGKADLSGHLAYLIDPEAHWTIEEVASGRAGPFSPLVGQYAGGFSQDAIWLSFRVERRTDGPTEVWLEVAPAYLDDVRLYIPQQDGSYSERRSGLAVSWTHRDVDYRQPLFRLLPGPGLTSYFLRLQSRTSLMPVLNLWQPLAFTEAAMAEARIWGLYFGIYAFIALFHALLWMWLQERVQYLFTLYVFMNLLIVLLAGGWLQQAQPDFWLPGLANGVRGALICLTLPVMQLLILIYVNLLLRAPPLWRHLLVQSANGVAAVGLVLVLTGNYDLAMLLAQPATLLYIAISMMLATPLAWTGNGRARLFILSFALYCLGLIFNSIRHLGWIAPGIISDNSFALASLAHVLVMSLAIFSDHKRLRREKNDAEAKAAAERHLREEQEDFLALVSHEVRTPLSIIDAASHNLLLSKTLDQRERARVEKIKRAGQRLARLMEDYLSAERLTSADAPLRRLATDLVRVCQAAMEDLDGTPGPEMILEATPVPPCHCDPDLTRLAIRNLLQNARQHSPPHSPIRIFITISGPGVTILVRDEGAGVPPHDLPFIFKRFRRGHNAGQAGAGLGLYLVEKVAHRHGGKVKVVNLSGRGCEFTFWLPMGDGLRSQRN